MKVLTVLTAALAAGLTTFAPNALEDQPQTTRTSLTPDRGIVALSAKQVQSDRVGKEGPSKQRGLTTDEVLEATKAFKAYSPDLPQRSYRAIVQRHASLNGVPLSLVLV